MTIGLSKRTAGAPPPSPPACRATVECGVDGACTVAVSGSWVRQAERPGVEEVNARLQELHPRRVRFADAGLAQWDSTLLAFLLRVRGACLQLGADVDTGGLSAGLARLLQLATAVPEHLPPSPPDESPSVVHLTGHAAIAKWRAAESMVGFVGACALALANAALGRAQFRRADLAHLLFVCGPDALGIISLIAFLMGLILAFVGAIQLRLFGAQIYVADLVGIGIVRDMGAIMTGVVMAGRSGAAFAAQLGTMQVNDEVDALHTMGINPVEFLVLPRLVALTLMMPVLCLYADLMGLIGGGVVGVGMMDIGLVQYWNQTRHAVSLNHVAVGVVMCTVFGVLVALAGCRCGLQCGRSSQEVGRAATSAVVTGMVWIVVATAVMTVLCDVLGV